MVLVQLGCGSLVFRVSGFTGSRSLILLLLRSRFVNNAKMIIAVSILSGLEFEK